MKNKILKITKKLAIVGFLFSAVPALASTIVLVPDNINITSGQTFVVTVSVDPSTVQNYAEKVELIYPKDLLEVKSFTFAPNWVQLTQSGYDSIDNTNGVLIKSAGLPSGFSTFTAFGTVTFSAKKAGDGMIKIGGGSLSFEANTQSALTGTGASVTTTVSNVTTKTVTPTTNSVSPTVTTKTPETIKPETTQFAQTAAALASGFNWNWLWLLLTLPIIGIIYYFVRDSQKELQK